MAREREELALFGVIHHSARSPLLAICLSLFGACLILMLYQLWLAGGRQNRRMHLCIASWCALSSAALFFEYFQYSASVPLEAIWSTRAYVGLYAWVPLVMTESLHAIGDTSPPKSVRAGLLLGSVIVSGITWSTELIFTSQCSTAVHIYDHHYHWVHSGPLFAPLFFVVVSGSICYAIWLLWRTNGLEPSVRRLLFLVIGFYGICGLQSVMASLTIFPYSLFTLAFPFVSAGFTYVAVQRYRLLQERLESLAEEQTRELAQKNETLDGALREARAATNAKSLFLANMSHELRTPMNGVLGLAELLQDGPLSDEQRQILDAMQHSGVTLLAILNDILDLSKIEAGHMSLIAQPFSLPEVLRNTARLLGVSATQKGLDLDWSIDENLDTALRGDAFRLQQILLNLTSNAIKFTSEGAVRIHASIDREEGTCVHVRIAVHDTGTGIAEADQVRIFDSFTQGDMSSTRLSGGAGLGLAISNQLSKLMGGSISLQSTPGEGSTFAALVPLELAPDITLPKVKRIPTQELSFLVKVLIVEDNHVNQVVAQKMLTKLGCVSEVAEEGQAALALLEGGSFDMVLMDCLMPVMDGFATTIAIREREKMTSAPRMPIVAMTANALEGDRERCLAVGMDDYIAKPMTMKQLRAQIVRWCRQLPATPADDSTT